MSTYWQDQLTAVEATITKIENAGQVIKRGDATVVMADLKTLYERQRYLKTKADAEAASIDTPTERHALPVRAR